jgi:hypothetical protein
VVVVTKLDRLGRSTRELLDLIYRTSNPAHCTPNVRCTGHIHGPGCGHEAVPHGDHVDYLVNGRLHHPHEGHCDDHGSVQLA